MSRYAALLLAAGIAVWIEPFITVEWTYPYCLMQDDGPAYAVFGMPFPYYTFGGVSSGEDLMLPHVYLLNLVLLSLLLFLVTRGIFARRASQPVRSMAGFAGAFLLLSMVLLQVLAIQAGFKRPATSLLVSGGRSWDLRPVGFTAFQPDTTRPCTPSPYLFLEKEKKPVAHLNAASSAEGH